jgi:streptogramin lyase
MCPQQLVRQLSMLGRNAATALLANLQEDLLQQSYATPEAAAAIGIDAGDNGSVHFGVALVKAAGALPPLPEHVPVQEQQQQPAASLPDAVKVHAGGDKQA